MKKILFLILVSAFIACNNRGEEKDIAVTVGAERVGDDYIISYTSFFANNPTDLFFGVEYPGSMVGADTIYQWHGHGTLQASGTLVHWTPASTPFKVKAYAKDNQGWEAIDSTVQN